MVVCFGPLRIRRITLCQVLPCPDPTLNDGLNGTSKGQTTPANYMQNALKKIGVFFFFNDVFQSLEFLLIQIFVFLVKVFLTSFLYYNTIVF